MWSRRQKGKEKGGEDNDRDNYNKHNREARAENITSTATTTSYDNNGILHILKKKKFSFLFFRWFPQTHHNLGKWFCRSRGVKKVTKEVQK